jgi:hypothetical protein
MDTAPPAVQRLIDLVHRRDVLVSERAKVVANLDAEITRIDAELSAAGGIVTPVAVGPADARQRSLTLGVRPGSHAETILLALARKPDSTIGELASEVYGDDTENTRHKIRAAQYHLRKTGRLAKPKEAA